MAEQKTRYEIDIAYRYPVDDKEERPSLHATVTVEWGAEQHELVSEFLTLLRETDGITITNRRQAAVRPNHGKRAKLASAVTK